MRLLLDHCVPRPLARLLVGHETRTAREVGWDDLSNGRLLAMAATAFDVLVTIDQNMMHQQDRGDLPLPVVVLISADCRLSALESLVPELLSTLGQDLLPRVYLVPNMSRA